MTLTDHVWSSPLAKDLYEQQVEDDLRLAALVGGFAMSAGILIGWLAHMVIM